MTPQAAARHASAPQTPPLPKAKPKTSACRRGGSRRLSEAFKREIDKGTLPGAVVMVGRGKVALFDASGGKSPASTRRWRPNSVFRIFSMTKPIVSVGIMQLLEEGRIMLNDPVAKYIPEFAEQQVGVENDGKLNLVPMQREITIQDLLRHTSGITYELTGPGLVQQLYQKSRSRAARSATQSMPR